MNYHCAEWGYIVLGSMISGFLVLVLEMWYVQFVCLLTLCLSQTHTQL